MIGRVILKDYASAMKPETLYYKSLLYEDGFIKKIKMSMSEKPHTGFDIKTIVQRRYDMLKGR